MDPSVADSIIAKPLNLEAEFDDNVATEARKFTPSQIPDKDHQSSILPHSLKGRDENELESNASVSRNDKVDLNTDRATNIGD